jgi:hypothetical protein
MMTAVESAAGTPADRIGTMTQVRGSIERMRAAGPAVVWLWVGLSAATLGLAFLGPLMGVSALAPRMNAGYAAFLALTAIESGLGGALSLRLLARGRDNWLQVDRGLLEGAVLIGAATLVTMLVAFGYTTMMVSNLSADGTPSAAAVPAVLAFGISYLVLMFVMLRLSLWPLGKLMARSDLTFGRAWRLMRRASRGFVLGYLLFAIPLMVLSMLNAQALMAGGTGINLMTLVSRVVGVAISIAGAGLIVTIYDLRVERPSSVADVFD